MSEPIYMLVIGKGYTEAWHQLSHDEQVSIMSKVEEAEKEAGGKWLIHCYTRWADEGTTNFAVIEYPNMDAYRHKVQVNEELGWYRYWQDKTLLGTKMPDIAGVLADQAE